MQIYHLLCLGCKTVKKFSSCRLLNGKDLDFFLDSLRFFLFVAILCLSFVCLCCRE